MIRFIFSRLLQAIPVLFIIASITFFMVRLAPGGPFTEEKTIPVEIRKKLEEHYGLDRPLWELCFGLSKVDKGRLSSKVKPKEPFRRSKTTLAVGIDGAIKVIEGGMACPYCDWEIAPLVG